MRILAFKEIGHEDTETLEFLGEYIAKQATKDPKYAIEVSARKILHKVPLHAVVWSFVNNFHKSSNINEIFNFIDQELCYFERHEEFYSVWISCK